MPKLQIPTVLYFESKLRICQNMMYIYGLELLYLEKQLEKREVDQYIYDDAVAAIDNDMEHLRSEIRKLTHIEVQEREAA